jgi:protein-tyrosine phosphatase
LANGRDGKSHNRNINDDILDFKEQGINLIVCLLNDYEMRSIGVSVINYKETVNKLDIQFIQYPIIEMAAPDSLESLEEHVLNPIASLILQGGFIIIHCRGGIGRAGTVGACMLKKLHMFEDYKKAILYIRKKRDKRCVESRRQEDFIKTYFKK